MEMSKERKERDEKIYEFAYGYLLKITQDNKKLIDNHTEPPKKPEKMEDIFKRLIVSSANRQMYQNVILLQLDPGKQDNIECLRNILCNFEPQKVFEKYSKSDALFEDIKNANIVKNHRIWENQTKKKNLWPKFCETILSIAHFLSKFEDFSDFSKWANFLYEDERSRIALPMIIEHEIKGIGFAIACDFLKEIGYEKYGKPDIHIKEIFRDLELSNSTEDYAILNDIIRIAQSVNKSPYNVDKIFWLCATGNFYREKKKFKTKRETFIKEAKEWLATTK